MRYLKGEIEMGDIKLRSAMLYRIGNAGEISLTIKSMVMDRKETPSDFYFRFLQKVG